LSVLSGRSCWPSKSGTSAAASQLSVRQSFQAIKKSLLPGGLSKGLSRSSLACPVRIRVVVGAEWALMLAVKVGYFCCSQPIEHSAKLSGNQEESSSRRTLQGLVPLALAPGVQLSPVFGSTPIPDPRASFPVPAPHQALGRLSRTQPQGGRPGKSSRAFPTGRGLRSVVVVGSGRRSLRLQLWTLGPAFASQLVPVVGGGHAWMARGTLSCQCIEPTVLVQDDRLTS
jgi:hypothetical protein